MIKRVVMFKDAAGEWRWQVRAGNGKVIAVSGEGYKKKAHCHNMASRLFDAHVEIRDAKVSRRSS